MKLKGIKMRQFIINITGFLIISSAMTHLGFLFDSWEHWIVLIGIVVIAINCATPEL